MSIELRIRNMMNENRDLEEIVEALLNISVSSRTKKNELVTIAQFLLLSGHHNEYFRQFPRRFYEKGIITWPHFVEILILQKIKVPKKIVDAIYTGCKETHALKMLSLNKKWADYDIRFKEIREKYWFEKSESIHRMRESLKQKIEFLKNNRMIQDEKKAFLKFKQMFPQDNSVDEMYKDFSERHARNILTKKSEQNKVKEFTDQDFSPLDEEQSQITQIIGKEGLTKITSNPKLAYDFAVMFISFEDYKLAFQIINEAPPSRQAHWLKLEILLLGKNYFQLLTEIEKVEEEFAESTEDSFALVYLKAQTYNLLNEKAIAADLLKSILSIRPSYRAAQAILNQILEEVS